MKRILLPCMVLLATVLFSSNLHSQSDEVLQKQIETLLSIKGDRTVDDFNRQLGLILWDHCGMSRTHEGLAKAQTLIRELRAEFWENIIVPSAHNDFNQSLERAGRVADFLEFAELMVTDANDRKESCGCHFNEAYQTEDSEA